MHLSRLHKTNQEMMTAPVAVAVLLVELHKMLRVLAKADVVEIVVAQVVAVEIKLQPFPSIAHYATLYLF